MEMPAPSERALALLDDLGGRLAAEGVTRGSMFGMPSLKAGRKVLCSVWGDAFVVKLPPDELDTALRLDGAGRFEPMDGRAMKEWVEVPFASQDRWAALVEASLAYEAGG